MSIPQPSIVDRRSSAEVSPGPAGQLDAACHDLGWLEQTARRTAWMAYGGLAAFILTLVMGLGLPAVLIPDRLQGAAGMWFFSCGVAAFVGVLQLVSLGARLTQPTDRLRRQLELSELAARIDAGLLEEHSRVRELYRKRPDTLAQLSASPRTKLTYLLGHLDLYLGSAPIIPLPARWVSGLAYGIGLLVALGFVLPTLIFSSTPLPLLYIAFLPAAWVRPRVDLAPRAAALAAYLRAAAARPRPDPAEPLAELERRCRFALDVNQLDLDLKSRLGGYGARPGYGPVWAAAIFIVLGTAAGVLGPSMLCFGTGIVLAAACLLGGSWLLRDAEQYRLGVRRWLENGDYLLRIATEELTADKLTERIPQAWRAWLGSGMAARWPQYHSGLKRTLWSAAFNASWVEAGCRLTQHPGFIGLVALVPLMLLGLGAGTSGAVWLAARHHFAGLDILGLLVAGLALFLTPGMLIFQWHGQRRTIAAEEFVALLQRRLRE